MRLLAIGDIHGCSVALDTLLAALKLQPDDQLVTLGDYVDRGPDSKGVLDRLLQLHDRCDYVPLRGNHDLMMERARFDPDWRRDWCQCGGDTTLRSYLATSSLTEALHHVPTPHWDFLSEKCFAWYECEQHIFVHAGLAPEMELDEQEELYLYWEKLTEPGFPHCSGKQLIVGHSQQKNGLPLDLGHTICIDTWVYGSSGWLTCLDVLTRTYWQANQRGEIRTGHL